MPASPANNYSYNKNLQPIAHKLRGQMTRAEACLWKYVLRARQMKGFQFRRQRPVLRYVADFMCKELMLVIEVDGGIHGDPIIERKDVERQHDLENIGFTVLRFTNDEVLNNIKGVFEAIEYWIEEKENTVPPPAPSRGG